MTEAARQRAAEIFDRLRNVENPRVVELGCQRGNLSNILLSRPDLHLTMVDDWLPGDQQPEHYKNTRDSNSRLPVERASLHRSKALQIAAKAGKRARVLEMRTHEAAKVCMGEMFDLVFIDADHSEEGVAQDIADWRGKARYWIGGHDYLNKDPRFDFSGVARAVHAAFNDVERGRNWTWWARP